MTVTRVVIQPYKVPAGTWFLQVTGWSDVNRVVWTRKLALSVRDGATMSELLQGTAAALYANLQVPTD
jgi:hypothetical protein